MGIYLSLQAVKWSLKRIENLPKNQTALLYFLIFAREPIVDRSGVEKESFEEEFYRYFGGPIKGGHVAPFDPFAGEWRAENYINSTVYGRLLVGSHSWTEGSESFFERNPASGGWPAKFTLHKEGFDNLRFRSSPPCLKAQYRLPLSAIAIYYYRFRELFFNPDSLDDLVSKYKEEVLSKYQKLAELFVDGPSCFDNLFSDHPPNEQEMIECYPPSPFSSEEKRNVKLYIEDVERIGHDLEPGEQIADYVRDVLSQKWRTE